MASSSDTGGPFSWIYYPPSPPSPPPVPEPVVLRSIKSVRSTLRPLMGTTRWPTSILERLINVQSIPIMSYEPDPRTYREDYYYNSKSNRLYVKIKTDPVPVWRPFGG